MLSPSRVPRADHLVVAKQVLSFCFAFYACLYFPPLKVNFLGHKRDEGVVRRWCFRLDSLFLPGLKVGQHLHLSTEPRNGL